MFFFIQLQFHLIVFSPYHVKIGFQIHLQHSHYSLQDQLWHTVAPLFCMQYVVSLTYWQH